MYAKIFFCIQQIVEKKNKTHRRQWKMSTSKKWTRIGTFAAGVYQSL